MRGKINVGKHQQILEDLLTLQEICDLREDLFYQQDNEDGRQPAEGRGEAGEGKARSGTASVV